jgi:hypothetical protein
MSKRVAKPAGPAHCWSLVKVCTGGRRMEAQCPERARVGFLTCAAHRRLEEEARLLEERVGQAMFH